MEILMIGGTRFSGRAMVEIATERGHKVTVFHRGKTNAGIHANAEEILGDREHDLEKLGDRTWDAVIDMCGYVPRVVGLSTERLKDRVGQYVFISTISVYQDGIPHQSDENAALIELPDPTVEQITGETYGGLKVLCERVVEAAFAGRALIPRPGLIIGPNDPTDRFPYWVDRIARGGDVLVPGDADRPVQMIDARDLAKWVIDSVEAQRMGTYTMTGPAQRLTWGNWMQSLNDALGSDAKLVWADDTFLAAHEVTPDKLPFYVPAQYASVFDLSVQKALDAGLTLRPVAESARDTLMWLGSRPEGPAMREGLSAEREAELLQLLKDA